MLGLSYGELFLLIGATAALVGPKDLPFIARNAGKLAGRAIGYVQLARGQFDNVMQQSQARQVHKELQDTIAQLEVIRHEIRSISLISPGPSTRRLMDNLEDPAPNVNSGKSPSEKCGEERKCEDEQKPTNAAKKDYSFKTSGSVDLHSQATAYARLAESEALKTSLNSVTEKDNLTDEASLFPVLPVSAESTGMLPDRKVPSLILCPNPKHVVQMFLDWKFFCAVSNTGIKNLFFFLEVQMDQTLCWKQFLKQK